VESSIPKNLRGIVLYGALSRGGNGENLGEDYVDVTVTVIVSTRKDYIFYSDRALKRFFRLFCFKVRQTLEPDNKTHQPRPIQSSATVRGNSKP